MWPGTRLKMVQRSRPCWMKMICFGSSSGTATLLRSHSKYAQPKGQSYPTHHSYRNLILSYNRQIPKMFKEISASKKQPDGKVQYSCFFLCAFLISWTVEFHTYNEFLEQTFHLLVSRSQLAIWPKWWKRCLHSVNSWLRYEVILNCLVKIKDLVIIFTYLEVIYSLDFEIFNRISFRVKWVEMIFRGNFWCLGSH